MAILKIIQFVKTRRDKKSIKKVSAKYQHKHNKRAAIIAAPRLAFSLGSVYYIRAAYCILSFKSSSPLKSVSVSMELLRNISTSVLLVM